MHTRAEQAPGKAEGGRGGVPNPVTFTAAARQNRNCLIRIRFRIRTRIHSPAPIATATATAASPTWDAARTMRGMRHSAWDSLKLTINLYLYGKKRERSERRKRTRTSRGSQDITRLAWEERYQKCTDQEVLNVKDLHIRLRKLFRSKRPISMIWAFY